MNWREYIHADPAVLGGKPVVRGTRLAADFLLGLLAAGWTPEQVLESSPALTAESLMRPAPSAGLRAPGADRATR